MDLRDIIVHLDKTDAASLRLEAAIGLAARFGARLTGLFAMADANVPSLSSRDRLQFVARRSAEVEMTFRERTTAAGLDAEWQTAVSVTDVQVIQNVVAEARRVDLIILGQHDPQKADGSVPPELVEDVTIRSGRPVLVFPAFGLVREPGRRILITWNGSREAVRALNDAMPFLVQAQEVVVLTLVPTGQGGAGANEAAPGEIVDHLSRYGVKARPERLAFNQASISPAERLLSHLADSGTDLLVMGAPGQAQTRRSLTRQVLSRLTTPLLVSY
jgi:nucleotide-binding universal stress UspA family protein